MMKTLLAFHDRLFCRPIHLSRPRVIYVDPDRRIADLTIEALDMNPNVKVIARPTDERGEVRLNRGGRGVRSPLDRKR